MQEVNEPVNVERAPEAPAPAERAGVAPSQAASDADEKRTRMSWLMVGAGAAIALGSLLPWATSPVGNASGMSVYLGWLTLFGGIALGLYGYQGLRKDDPIVRHHGWAITAVSVSIVVTVTTFGAVEDLSDLGGVVNIGAGLYMALIASLFAIWPLVQLRKDGKLREAAANRQEVSAMASQIAGQAPSTPAQAERVQAPAAERVQAPAAEQVQSPAGWYADPTSRHQRRYFDGATWTEHVVDEETRATDPIG